MGRGRGGWEGGEEGGKGETLKCLLPSSHV